MQEKNLVTTGYCKCGKCCGWERTWYGKPVNSAGAKKGRKKLVGVTARGTRARRGTIAADTQVFPFDTVMYIPGYGYGIVEDRGGAIKGYHVDLFFSAHRKAMEWGRRVKRVKIWVPRGKKRAA
jgi:3D (Asp-Asp-Asp) domain-containing protein